MRGGSVIGALAFGLTVSCGAGLTPRTTDLRNAASDSIRTLAPDQWRQAEIAGLVLYTNASDVEAQQILRRTDQFLSFASDFLGDLRLDGVVTALPPTEIYLFASDEQLRLFVPDPRENGMEVAGYVTSAFQTATLASSVRATQPALAVFRHELVHVAHLGDRERRFPPWAMEGFANYLSTVILRSDVLTLGRPSDSWMVAMRLSKESLPLAQILSWDRNEAAEVNQLYRDSYAFVHYGLQSEVFGGPSRVGAFRDFVDRVGRGEPWQSALETSFGASLRTIEAEYSRHWERLRRSEINTVVHLKVPFPTHKVEFLDVPRTEIIRRLARFAGRAEGWGTDIRRQLYDELLESNDGDPEALLGRMRVSVVDGDRDLARSLWTRVPTEARESRDALIARAELSRAHWRAELVAKHDRDDFVEARDSWARVLAVEPEYLPALLAIGELYVENEEEDPSAGLDALRRAIDIDPYRRSTRLAHARLLVRAGEVDTARDELGRLAEVRGRSPTAREARRLLKELR